MQARSPNPRPFISPIAGEPSRPATLARMLMNPIATAASEADRVSVGRTQNGDGQKKAKNSKTQSQAKTAAHAAPGPMLAARQAPASTWPMLQCHFRSPNQSDDRPETQTPASPNRKAMPSQLSTSVGSASLPVAGRGPLTAVGSQKAAASPPMFDAKMPS